jgi:hypothetical protein
MSLEKDEQKWKALAQQYREAAERLPFGARREDMLRRARQLETASKASAWATSPGLKPAGSTISRHAKE